MFGPLSIVIVMYLAFLVMTLVGERIGNRIITRMTIELNEKMAERRIELMMYSRRLRPVRQSALTSTALSVRAARSGVARGPFARESRMYCHGLNAENRVEAGEYLHLIEYLDSHRADVDFTHSPMSGLSVRR